MITKLMMNSTQYVNKRLVADDQQVISCQATKSRLDNGKENDMQNESRSNFLSTRNREGKICSIE